MLMFVLVHEELMESIYLNFEYYVETNDKLLEYLKMLFVVGFLMEYVTKFKNKIN